MCVFLHILCPPKMDMCSYLSLHLGLADRSCVSTDGRERGEATILSVWEQDVANEWRQGKITSLTSSLSHRFVEEIGSHLWFSKGWAGISKYSGDALANYTCSMEIYILPDT